MRHHLLLLSVSCWLAVGAIVPSATATEPAAEDFVAQATRHCSAFVSTGEADWGFTRGKDAGTFSAQEQVAFNQQYSQNLREQYGIASAKSCTLGVVSRKTEARTSFPQARSHYRSVAQPEREIAVAQGVLEGKLPVSIAYRFERVAADAPWRLVNVSLNGQPLENQSVERPSFIEKARPRKLGGG